MVNGNDAVFANAAIHVAKAEAEHWRQQDYPAEALNPRFFAAYADKITTFAPGAQFWGEIRAHDAAGHTPGHTSFRLGRLWFIGDTVPRGPHFPDPHCAPTTWTATRPLPYAGHHGDAPGTARSTRRLLHSPALCRPRRQHATVAYQFSPYAGEALSERMQRAFLGRMM